MPRGVRCVFVPGFLARTVFFYELCEGEKLNQDNLVLCHCLFGVPLPVPWLIFCVNLTWAGFDSWHHFFEISEEKNSEECQYVLVDKKAGVINAYQLDFCWRCGDVEKACCTLVPLTSLTTKVDGISSFPAPQS